MREDVDIGSLKINNLQKKSRCVQIKLGEVIDVMPALRHTQLNFIYYRFKLNEPIDDIAPDVSNTLSLMDKFRQMPQLLHITKPKCYVEAVQVTMSLDNLKNIPMFLQKYLDGIECISI